jgi:ubiquinone biosynthesis protein COQ9
MKLSLILNRHVANTMTQNPSEAIRDELLAQALPDVVFDGWTWDVVEQAALKAGYDKTMARAVFPGGLSEFVSHLSDWADRQMLEKLAHVDISAMRVRDRIHLGVMTRLDVLAPWREPVRRAMTYWTVPTRSLLAARSVWRSADRIWIWAGDTATDYNHYTKRGLLSGVISATTLAWLNDDNSDPEKVSAFLDRRLDHVLKLGRALGRFKKTA